MDHRMTKPPAVGVEDEHLGGLLDSLQGCHLQGGEVGLHVAHLFEVAAELLAGDGENLIGVATGELDVAAASLVVAAVGKERRRKKKASRRVEFHSWESKHAIMLLFFFGATDSKPCHHHHYTAI